MSAAVVADFTDEKIPNGLILTGLVTGLYYRIVICRETSAAVILADLFFPLLIFFIFFILKAFGAGDIKLFIICGLFLGTTKNLLCICLAFAVAAMNGLLRLLIQGILLSRFETLLRYMKCTAQKRIGGSREIEVYLSKERKEEAAKVHFSMPVLIGATLTLLITGGI